ncbi:MAG TPA: tetratricopeptide repeat protein, partial [Rhizobiales bacterium]|nr:tetratricopeptide repeat protein [Hyphomicrobiales bacterium]
GTSPGDTIETGSIRQPSLTAAMKARKVWEANPSNLKAGMLYARELNGLGQSEAQLKVLEQLMKYHPKNVSLQVYYGKMLLRSGQASEAINMLRQAESRGARDWKLYSALGSALDQQKRHAEARQYYQRALKLNPGGVSIMNNMAMSYALENKLSESEAILRKTYATPAGRAEPRIRQNLALVVGLQGRFDEARTIASRDLPPAQVEANMAYLKKMLGRNNTWSKLKKS